MTTEEKNALANRVRRLCAERKFSQHELARRAGISQRGVSELMAARYAPRLDTFVRICRALDVSADRLLGMEAA